MNIVVLVKQVPDTYSERKLADSDHTLDRESTDAVIDEINERSVEAGCIAAEGGQRRRGYRGHHGSGSRHRSHPQSAVHGCR